MNPTGQPFGGAPMSPPPQGAGGARDALNAPGILLIVLGAIGVLMALVSLLPFGSQEAQLAAMLDNPDLPSAWKELIPRLTGLSRLSSLVSMAVYGVVIAGGVQLRNLKSYPLAVAACFAAMLPCQCACCFGIPVGIWTLIVLFKPEVRAQFS
jgi:hypothetical protein